MNPEPPTAMYNKTYSNKEKIKNKKPSQRKIAP